MRTDSLERLLKAQQQSQWLSSAELQVRQFQQLRNVLQHAIRFVPYYRNLFAEYDLDPESVASPGSWPDVPLLTRFDIQEAMETLHSERLPAGHGPVCSRYTSGSTGTAVKTLATGVTSLFWRAATLRDHDWHQRDFSGKLASIRYLAEGEAKPPSGLTQDHWGSATEGVHATGPGCILSVSSTTAEQADWLLRENPEYLMIYPSALETLLDHCQQEQLRPSKIQEVRTFGEVQEPSLRTLCRQVWDVPIVDVYSCQEVGYIALQCSEAEHYHVQAEDLLVEVLSDDGRPCQPGEVGRLVVTTLHNFAMPLLRYELGDYAEVGPVCSCGRGLPVLKRIQGRSVNMFTLPNGDHVWPSLDLTESEDLMQLPVRQYQVVQRDRQHVDAHLVVLRPLTSDEEAVAARSLQRATRYPFDVTFHYVDRIERGPGGKYEEFRSAVR